ncbi:MAG: hypothetical protein KDA22_00375 [Phycisphaerales bacterium]|nr:hypothetical protein [Phycisphaerales bacterium]
MTVPPTPSPSPVVRLVGTIAAILGFVALASMFTPDTIRAAEPAQSLERGSARIGGGRDTSTVVDRWETYGATSVPIEHTLDRFGFGDTESEPSGLGVLVGGRYVVRLHAGNPVTFSVYGTDGMPLAGPLTAAELKERFPQLDIEHVHASQVKMLMLAEPVGGEGAGWGR